MYFAIYEANTTNCTTDFTNIYENLESTSKKIEETKGSKYIQKPGKPNVKERAKKIDKDDDIDIDEKIHDENPYGEYMNEELIPDILIEKLENVIREKSKDDDDGFKKEYAALPYGERYACKAGRRPENSTKNRYKTTYPYDHSRIRLAEGPSDYINANFIDGTERKNTYIAAQGPKKGTLSDFWVMVWQENVKQIVMVTGLREGTKIKCTQYWPDLGTGGTYGVFSVRNEEEKHYAFYVIRRFRVTHTELGNCRTVTQYHYTAWPDHGTPEPLCLVAFHDHVTRTHHKQIVSPVLVHCSAGIGRTGTYIAIDALYNASKTEKKINIAEYVKEMRKNRMNMIQTYEQYKTIFLALNAMIKAPFNIQNKTEYVKKLESMAKDQPANESELRQEFKKLLSLRPSYDEVDYKLALQAGNERSSILPLDRYILFLTSSVPNHSSYINAVCLPSFTTNKAFIVTPYPPPEDTVDFLRLLTDHESHVVIFMDPLTNVASSKKWLPSMGCSLNVPPFTVHSQQEKNTKVKCTTVDVVRNGTNNETCSVVIVEPICDLKSTGHSNRISQILSLVSFVLQRKGEIPITIASSDGAELCGVFCTVHNVVQQLTQDGDLDVFSAIRQLQIRRPELCSTMEEYKMIHDAVSDYIRIQENYSDANVYFNQ